MHKLLNELRKDHIDMESLLEQLSKQLDRLVKSGKLNPDYMQDCIEFVDRFPNLIHHPTEEALLKVLDDNHTDSKDLLTTIVNQHAEIKHMTAKLSMLVNVSTEQNPDSQKELQFCLDRYINMQTEHIDFEENTVFPYLETTLTDEDWVQAESLIPKIDNPMFCRESYDKHKEQLGRLLP